MTYLSLEAQLHDAFWENEGPPGEIPLLGAFLRRHPGRALEIGSGSGRLLFPLHEAGIAIEGLELSPDMLALARAAAEKRNLSPILHHGDQDDFELGGERFSAIAIPAFTLQLSRDPAGVLRRCHDHLRPSGGLYITTFLPWVEIVGEMEEGEWEDDNAHNFPDGRVGICRTRMTIDRIGQQLHREHHYRLYHADDSLADEHFSEQKLTWFWQNEMELMLAAAGFGNVAIVHDFSPDQEDTAPHVLTFTAQRSNA